MKNPERMVVKINVFYEKWPAERDWKKPFQFKRKAVTKSYPALGRSPSMKENQVLNVGRKRGEINFGMFYEKPFKNKIKFLGNDGLNMISSDQGKFYREAERVYYEDHSKNGTVVINPEGEISHCWNDTVELEGLNRKYTFVPGHNIHTFRVCKENERKNSYVAIVFYYEVVS